MPGASADFPAGHFRPLDGLIASSIGLGTYLGDEDDRADRDYGQAIVDAANSGCNLLDTAINYRGQRSERVIGQALLALERDLGLARAGLVVCTKGGYIPFEGGAPAVNPDVLKREDVVGGVHCMTPRYLEDQLGWSLRNLGLAAVDVYYVHNPETQLATVARTDFLVRIRAAFELLEAQVAAGRVGRYGVATWNGFRTRPDAREHLSLAELVREAEAVAGRAHHFKVIQLPYNLAMPEAYAAATQVVDGERLTPVAAAERLGIAVVASASILQGQLSRRLPQALVDAFPGLETSAQRALQFVRSTPGITSALVGMGQRDHVAENLAVARVAPSPAAVASLFRQA
jgi:aryl-alcohol dehydrogenase-like predicted oxidoreductase